MYNFFKSKNYQVKIFTNIYNNPIKKYFNDEDVFTSTHDIEIDKFDLIWNQHCLLSLFFKKISSKTKLKIVSVHLSPFNEYELSSVKKLNLPNVLFVANSEETKDKLIELGVNDHNIIISYNAAPSCFLNEKKAIKKLKKIAVISNHPPPEILDLKNKLSKEYKIDFIGLDKKILVTKDIILNYDLIISIGKTVQYCLLSETPIYCYDHFGGPGYINEFNYEKAKYYNFSGRGFDRKSSNQIALEIINKFNESINFFSLFKEKEKFILEIFMEDFLNKIEINPLKKEEQEVLSSYFYHEKIIFEQNGNIQNIQKEYNKKRKYKKLFLYSLIFNLLLIVVSIILY